MICSSQDSVRIFEQLADCEHDRVQREIEAVQHLLFFHEAKVWVKLSNLTEAVAFPSKDPDAVCRRRVEELTGQSLVRANRVTITDTAAA